MFVLLLSVLENGSHIFKIPGGVLVIKVNQEQLQEKIKKLKQAAAEKASKAAGKKSDPEVRAARKQVKRAQRQLRSVKAYKSGGAKKTETKTEEKASA